MCDHKFSVYFKLNVACIDDEHNVVVSLIAKRKNLNVIPPVGMHIIFDKFDVEVTGISTPFTFDIVTCRCQIYKPLTYEQVLELMKHGWREDLKHGEVSKLTTDEDIS